MESLVLFFFWDSTFLYNIQKWTFLTSWSSLSTVRDSPLRLLILSMLVLKHCMIRTKFTAWDAIHSSPDRRLWCFSHILEAYFQCKTAAFLILMFIFPFRTTFLSYNPHYGSEFLSAGCDSCFCLAFKVLWQLCERKKQVYWDASFCTEALLEASSWVSWAALWANRLHSTTGVKKSLLVYKTRFVPRTC